MDVSRAKNKEHPSTSSGTGKRKKEQGAKLAVSLPKDVPC